jgi:subtilisin family serine protease
MSHGRSMGFGVSTPARLLVLAAALALSTAASTAGDGPPPLIAYVTSPPATLVVRTDTPGDLPRAEDYAWTHGLYPLRRITALSAVEIALPDGAVPAATVAGLRAVAGVRYVEQSARFAATDIPADPLFARQSYLDVERAPEAWDIEVGDASVIVAVLDTGVDARHPDLAGRIWRNPRESTNGADDDANGCIDDVNGCAFVEAGDGCPAATNGDVRDTVGHGTFVAGVIAANSDGQGIVGVARGVTVMPVRVLDCEGSGNSVDLAQGIRYAVDNGARIINISLGGDTDSLIVREAVAHAHDRGVLIAAASGNSGGSGVAYPARYPTVLAVGAASAADPSRRAPVSTAGPEVDVVAIGEGIVSTVPRSVCGASFFACLDAGAYAQGDGTSFAVPQVAGLAALMMSRVPGLSPDAIIGTVRATARPLPPGDLPDWAGAGLVDMAAALQPRYRLGVPGTGRS